MGNTASSIGGLYTSGTNAEEVMFRMPISDLQTLLAKNVQLLKTMGRVLVVRGEKVPPEVAGLLASGKQAGFPSMPVNVSVPMDPMMGSMPAMSMPGMPMQSMASMPGANYGNMYAPQYNPMFGGTPKKKRQQRARSPKSRIKRDDH
jgi:hypothetical protein